MLTKVRSGGKCVHLHFFPSSLTCMSRGFFTPASMFNDLGFTLTPDSMISFQRAILPLLIGTFLIVIGNTGFPCMLRFVIWLLSKIVPYRGGLWEELRFLLDHPRRCFTLLFPSDTNWWLFWVLIILNGIDLIFFVILDVSRNAFSLCDDNTDGSFSFMTKPSPYSPAVSNSSTASSKPHRPVPQASPSSTSASSTQPSRSPTSS